MQLDAAGGVKVFDVLKYFKGDKPAAEFKAGISCGGTYPCVGCICSASQFGDFAHATSCKQRSLESNQEVALKGKFGKRVGVLKFYDDLSTEDLRRELEARGVKDYPTTKKGRTDALKGILSGVQRVPSLLMFSPESSLSDLNLQDYEVLSFEPLHDLKGYLGRVLKKLPSVIPVSDLKEEVSMYLESVWKKAHLYGSDLREALIEIAYVFGKRAKTAETAPVRIYVECLVQISRILYSLDVNRTPKQCLQYYNCAFLIHELHLELFGSAMTTMYFHALLIHGPQQHEAVCSHSVNAENEERLFKSAANAAKCTDRKPENMLPGVFKGCRSRENQRWVPSTHSVNRILVLVREQQICPSIQAPFSRLGGSKSGLLPGRLTSRGLPTSSSKEWVHGGVYLSQVMFISVMVSLMVTIILMGHIYSMPVHLTCKMLL